MRMLLPLWTAAALAAGCEESFSKAGNPLTGTKYSAFVTVPALAVADAVAQLHGIAVQRKLDILSEDPAGSMLLEQRESMRHRAIPYVVSVTDEAGAARISLMVKLDKGALAKTGSVRDEICAILSEVKGGDDGKAAAAAGGEATAQQAVRKVDAFLLSLEITRQANASAESIPLRYKGRAFTVTGRVKYVIKDGGVYRVAYDLPGTSKHTAISCLMQPSQSAWAVALREGEKVKLTGTFANYDQFVRVMWLQECRPE